MNLVDLIIIGTVGLLALLGLRSGLLLPASGIGGLVLGLALAVQYHGQLAFALSDQVEDETIRRVAASAVLVLGGLLATRIAASFAKKLLSSFKLGWIDPTAGALAGAGMAVVGAGTIIFVLMGTDIVEVHEALNTSAFAAPMSQASLLSTRSPWCSQMRLSGATVVPKGVGAQRSSGQQECTELRTLARELLGGPITDKLSSFLGHDVETLGEIVKTNLTGSPDDLKRLAQER